MGDSVCVWALLIVLGRGGGSVKWASSALPPPASSPDPSALWDLGSVAPSWPMQPSCPSPLRQPVNVVGARFPARAAVDG